MTLGYVIVRSFITDAEAFEQHRYVIGKLMETFGGRYLIRTDRVGTLVGGESGFTLTVAEYPSLAAVDLLLTTPEHGPLHQALVGQGTKDVWAVSGVEVPESAPPSAGPRGYALALAHGAPRQPPESNRTLIGSTLRPHGGRTLIGSDQVRVVAGTAQVRQLVLVEFPSLPKLAAALPASAAQSLWRNLGVQQLWTAPGIG